MRSSKEIDRYIGCERIDRMSVICIYDVDYNCGRYDDDNEDDIFDDDECGAKYLMMMNVVQKMTEERMFAELSRHVTSFCFRCTDDDDDDV